MAGNPNERRLRRKGNRMDEIYRLRLDHFLMMDVENKEYHRLEEPLVVQVVIDRSYMPKAVCLNNMMDMMKAELLRRAGENNK